MQLQVSIGGKPERDHELVPAQSLTGLSGCLFRVYWVGCEEDVHVFTCIYMCSPG